MKKLFDVPLKTNRMYLRGEGKKTGNVIVGNGFSTDTYYGCFPCETYADNTTLQSVRACLKVKGTGKAELRWLKGNEDRGVAELGFSNAAFDTVYLPFVLSDYPTGCMYLKVTGELEVSGIWYEGELRDGKTDCEQELRIAILICTFHREEFVLKNLRKLTRAIAGDLLLRNCIEIICVDNGRTLTEVPAGVMLVQNRNYGGSGGYARGMMEARKRGSYTHFWMMDDDIRFEPVILRRAVTFMQYRKTNDIRLAAGMFSFKAPSVQVEATAVFNGYTFTSNASGLDFRNRDSLLNNTVNPDHYTYGGWWSFIMPVSEELPMPFFIKIDDVEYGIRTSGSYVIMNGFGVWHEAFGKKGSAWPEYYTTRNTLIVQSMYPELPHSPEKMMGIRLLKALAYGEPKCMEAAYRGVKDYAAGAEVFRKTNPEELHKQLLTELKAPLISGMTRKKMLKAALKNLWKPGSWRSIGLFLKSVRMLSKYREDDGWKELCTEGFWKEYLGMK